MDWNPEWGEKADYQIDESITEVEGFKVGERVRVTEDSEEGLIAGDEGVIVGISHIEAGSHPMSRPTRDDLVIVCDGMDPVGVSPADVEHE